MAGLVDIHCHALPGVDDGAADVAVGLDMVRRSADEGVDAVVLTPHFRPEDGAERVAQLQRAFDGFVAVAAEVGVALHLGAELGFRFGLAEVGAAHAGLRLAGGPYVLVDLPPGPLSPGLEQAFFQMRTAGLRPVLAHPERHRLLAVDPQRLAALRQQDLLLQVDAGSLRGRFGRRAQAAAVALVEAGQADFVGSDGHDLARRPPALRSAYAQVAELAGQDEARRLFADNPRRVLSGVAVVAAPVRDTAGRGLLARWQAWRHRRGARGSGLTSHEADG